eukprot:1156365-Pelagomonas_calceolata.AAC.3
MVSGCKLSFLLTPLSRDRVSGLLLIPVPTKTLSRFEKTECVESGPCEKRKDVIKKENYRIAVFTEWCSVTLGLALILCDAKIDTPLALKIPSRSRCIWCLGKGVLV